MLKSHIPAKNEPRYWIGSWNGGSKEEKLEYGIPTIAFGVNRCSSSDVQAEERDFCLFDYVAGVDLYDVFVCWTHLR